MLQQALQMQLAKQEAAQDEIIDVTPHDAKGTAIKLKAAPILEIRSCAIDLFQSVSQMRIIRDSWRNIQAISVSQCGFLRAARGARAIGAAHKKPQKKDVLRALPPTLFL